MYGKLDFSRKIWLTFFLFYFSSNSRFFPHQILSNGSIFLNPEHFVKYSFSLGMRLQCCNCSRSFTTFNYLQPFEEVKSRAVNYNQGSITVYQGEKTKTQATKNQNSRICLQKFKILAIKNKI